MRRLAVAIAAGAFGWACAVAATGGFTLRAFGLRLSSHQIAPPVLVAVLAAWYWYRDLALTRREGIAEAIDQFLMRRQRTLVHLAAALTFALALGFGTFAAAGADAFGYLAQARLWSSGRLVVPAAFGGWASWPNHEWAVLPLGFRPGPEPGTGVPTYPPGLPILMAAASFVAPAAGPFVVVPALGALAVLLAARLARSMGGPLTVVASAALVAVSPIFLYQLVQPMTDVPVTALWLLALVASLEGGWTGALGGGLAASIAILVRPNLAPVASIPLALTLTRGSVGARAWRGLLFVAGATPGVALSAWTNDALYGSVLISGYGSASELFSFGRIVSNLWLYAVWLVQMHSLLVVAGVFAPGVVGAPLPDARRAAWAGVAFIAAVLACYLPYYEYDHWSYLRFLLPAIAVLIPLTVGVITTIASRRASHAGGLVTMALAVFLGLWFVHRAVAGSAFGLRQNFRARAIGVAEQIDRRFPHDTAFLAVVQSGSVRYYTGRDAIVRFDLIEPDRLDEVLAWLRERRMKPYVLIEHTEVEGFRARFGHASRAGRLDSRPIAELPGGTFVYDPALPLTIADDQR